MVLNRVVGLIVLLRLNLKITMSTYFKTISQYEVLQDFGSFKTLNIHYDE